MNSIYNSAAPDKSEPDAPSVNVASNIKRRRATRDEMEERAKFLVRYARAHGPVSVRGLYYQAEVAQVPGIDKTDSAYNKVQRQVLSLRREGRLAYRHIADATRWMRKPKSFDSAQEAVDALARSYRRNLWRDADSYVEVWIEKDALAGVIYPVTSKYDVPLMVARGFSSETFAYEAVAAREDDARDYYVYYLGDFDRAGIDAARSLQEKLERFADELPNCLCSVTFIHLAVTEEQVRSLRLPTREPKRESAADKKWPHNFCCELDALPPDDLRSMVERVILRHLPRHQFEIEKTIEQSEREGLLAWARAAGHE